jgi:hypothetical protein
MRKVDEHTTGTYDGIIYIIQGDIGKTLIISASGDENDRFFSLHDCLTAFGYNGEGSVLVIIEDYTKGKVYRYNNYGDKKWYECGSTEGFA